VRIVTDSLADIPADIARQLQIEVVPAVVIIDGITYRDKVDLTDAEFYELLTHASELPTTSQPPVGDFEAVYSRLARTAEHIISIHIPAKVSGTVASAQAAAARVDAGEIMVIDATQISMALGWLVIVAARAAQDGEPFKHIMTLIEQTIPRLRLLAVLDTLEYARRGGRIGRAEAMMGAVLRVKPVIAFRDSEIVPLENVRTLHRALDRVAQMVEELGTLEEAAVIHAAAPEAAEMLRDRLAPLHPAEPIIITEAGPVLGTHAGPGAVGVACIVSESSSL
jgi:DegV family protein with EDD domain